MAERTGNRSRADSSAPMLARPGRHARHDGGNDAGNDSDNVVDMLPVVHVVHAAPAVRPAMQAAGASLSVDSVVQRRLARCKDRMDLAAHRLAQASGQGRDTRRAVDELNESATAYHRLLRILDPSYLLEKTVDDATRQAYEEYQASWRAYQAETISGSRKHLHNLAAGAVGNLLCFGLGGIAGAHVGSPLLGLAINTCLWTFSEPLISMMRATTVTNPNLDRYMIRQQRQARALRDWIAGSNAREAVKKIAWRDPASGELAWISVEQWLARTSWVSLWHGKRLTDDLIYFVYSVAYGATGSLPEFLGKSLYDMSTWQGRLAYGGIRAAGGMVAGAIIQEGVQLLRSACIEKTGGRELVTKPRAVWASEARYVARLLDGIASQLARPGVDPVERRTLEMLEASLVLWHDKALAKSRLATAVGYEWRAMCQSKRMATGIDPEVPGKRLDTLASLIGKGLSQAPGIAVGAFAGSIAIRSSAAWVRWTGYVVPPLASIGLLGFSVRREWEVLARSMLGAAHGVYRRCGARCCCNADEHEVAGA